MKVLLFGGNKGAFFVTYLQIWRQRIADYMEEQLRKDASEKDVKEHAKKKFLIPKFEIDINDTKITDTHSEKKDSHGYILVQASRITKEYKITLKFTGDLELLNYRPTNYTGIDKEVEIEKTKGKNEYEISVYFKCLMNNQTDFDRSKASCFVSFYENSMELNKLIESANKDIDHDIENIYKKVIEYKTITDEFNKRNNIIT